MRMALNAGVEGGLGKFNAMLQPTVNLGSCMDHCTTQGNSLPPIEHV